MKYKRQILAVMIICGLLLFACGGKDARMEGREYGVVAIRVVTTEGDTVVSCQMENVKDSIVFPLSCLIDSVEIIRLDNQKGALLGKGNVCVSGRFICVYSHDMPCKLFTRQGEYVCNIGNIGQGPGEYISLSDCQIDETYNRIYLMPWNADRILAYDLQGKHIGDIPLAFPVRKGCFKVNQGSRLVYLVQAAWENEGNPAIWIQDFKGNVINEMRDSRLIVRPSFGNEVLVSHRSDSQIVFSVRENLAYDSGDTLFYYSVAHNKITPVLAVKRMGKEGFGLSLREIPNFYIIGIWGSCDIPGCVSMEAGNIIIDKMTLRGGYLTVKHDLMGDIPIIGWFSETGYVANLEPGVLLEAIEKRLGEEDLSDKDREFLEKWKESISEDDNNYIIYGKYK